MRKYILLCVFSLFIQFGNAQKSISLGYLGHSIAYPGAQLAMNFIPDHSQESDSTKSKKYKSCLAFTLGHYQRTNYYYNTILNAKTGFRRQRPHKKSYSELTVGLGYINQREVQSFAVDLSGNISNHEIEIQSYFFPSINLQLGRSFGNQLGMYTELSFGQQISTAHDNVSQIFLGLGLNYTWPKPSKISGQEINREIEQKNE